jgi:hypothetical protein
MTWINGLLTVGLGLTEPCMRTHPSLYFIEASVVAKSRLFKLEKGDSKQAKACQELFEDGAQVVRKRFG